MVMKRNVNFGLLALLVAVLVCFSIAAIYYQQTFGSLSKESKSKLSELQKVTTTLLQKKEELATTSEQKKTLETKYTDVKEQKETIEEERDRLEDELDEAKSELLETKDSLKKEQELSSLYLNQRDEFKAQRDSFKSDLAGVCDYISDNLDKGISKPSECDYES